MSVSGQKSKIEHNKRYLSEHVDENKKRSHDYYLSHRKSTKPYKPRKWFIVETIEIMNIREIPRDYAKLEIAKYMYDAGDRKVYISEIVEELCLDIEFVKNIVEEIENEKVWIMVSRQI